MHNLKLSIAIPYKQRLENIALAFEALANQTMDSAEFEVVVGAMEYCEEYVALCREFADRINIVSVLSGRDFAIPRARNLAIRQASGQILVQMDADTLLPADALENLYERHFAFCQNICVVGQVVGYGNNDKDVTSVERPPYAEYQKSLDSLASTTKDPLDPRFQVAHVIPWSFGWTGLIALPMATVRKHGLYFDETFQGWGADDLEWSYRVCASGTPIVLKQDVWAMHLPHARDVAANRVTERANYRRFVEKWPTVDVELANTFGDMRANRIYPEFRRELLSVTDGGAHNLGIVRGTIDGTDVLVFGAAIDASGRVRDPELLAQFSAQPAPEVLPLVGIAVPFDDNTVEECRLLPPIAALSARYRDAVCAEADRVAKHPAPNRG